MKRPIKDKGGYAGFAFSRTVGMKYWCCARCNQVNRTQMRPQTWMVTCSNEACSARWAVGEVFYEIDVGFKAQPPDTIMPAETPMRTGARINQVYCASCSKVIYDDVFHRALIADGDPEHTYGGYAPIEWEKQGFERRKLRALERRALTNPEEMGKLMTEVRRIATALGYEVTRPQQVTENPNSVGISFQ